MQEPALCGATAMRRNVLTCVAMLAISFVTRATVHAQEKEPLPLIQTIPMPNVKGRIDHMDVDVKGKPLFVAGLENGSVEVVDLRAGKWVRTIPRFQKPQGVAYVPSLNNVFVASGHTGRPPLCRP